jgi:hypothetical protein
MAGKLMETLSLATAAGASRRHDQRPVDGFPWEGSGHPHAQGKGVHVRPMPLVGRIHWGHPLEVPEHPDRW